MAVEALHELRRPRVADVPEAGHDRFRSGVKEGLRQPLHAFTRKDSAARRPASREHDQIAREPQTIDLSSAEQTVIARATASGLLRAEDKRRARRDSPVQEGVVAK